jgi:hypothetical protein
MIAEAAAPRSGHHFPTISRLRRVTAGELSFCSPRIDTCIGGDMFRTQRRFTEATTHRRALLTILGMAA